MSDRKSDMDMGNNTNQGLSQVQMEALFGHFSRMMKVELEPLHERMSRLEVSSSGGKGKGRVGFEDEFDGGFEEESQNENWGRNRRERGMGRDRRDAVRGRYNDGGREDNNMSNIKLNIPPFHGKSDPEAYLEWEKRVEFVFDCHNYSEAKKVKLAVVEFLDYALIWWDQLVTTKRRYNERPIGTWEEMKVVMRKRFVSNHYYRELFKKLQGMRQGTKSVEDYFKEMEVAMIRANVEEDAEATMARFLCGLNREIQDQVELRHYMDLYEMVQMATKVEQQLRRRVGGRPNQIMGASTTWRQSAENREEVKVETKPKFEIKLETPKQGVQGKSELSTTRTRDLKCFRCQGLGQYSSQCPNKRVMIINARGDVESESEHELGNDSDSKAELEDLDGGYGDVVGEALVARRLLNSKIINNDASKRESLFHTRCFVKGKVCGVIIDGGSCTCVASVEMVKKLSLPTLKHPQPYKLQWLNDGSEVKVTTQVVVNFSIGKYEDEVLCDVAPMHACHILLGRPWQYDRRVMHDGFLNRYSFTLREQNVVLLPMSPKQVLEEQLKRKEKKEMAEKQNEQKSEVAIEKEKEKKFEEAEKKREIKSEMAKNEKKERKENEWKETEKNNFMVQNSELQFSMHTHAPLVLILHKEFLLNTSVIAGSFPSIVVSNFQGCGCGCKEKSKSLDDGGMQWYDPSVIKSHQGEVMVVVNTTPMRYVFISSWISGLPYFEGLGKEFINKLTRFRGIVIISFDLMLRSWGVVFVNHNCYRVVGLIGIRSNTGLHAIVLNCGEVFGEFVFYLFDKHKSLKCYGELKDDMNDKCGTIYFHDYMCWEHLKEFVSVICGSGVSFGQGKFRLHVWQAFISHYDQLLCTYKILSLGLTRSNKGRNLIFVILNGILLHISIMRLQGIQMVGDVEVLKQEDDYTYKLHEQGKNVVNKDFCVTNLLWVCVGEELDLRTNPFQEGEDDTIMDTVRGQVRVTPRDALKWLTSIGIMVEELGMQVDQVKMQGNQASAKQCKSRSCGNFLPQVREIQQRQENSSASRASAATSYRTCASQHTRECKTVQLAHLRQHLTAAARVGGQISGFDIFSVLIN